MRSVSSRAGCLIGLVMGLTLPGACSRSRWNAEHQPVIPDPARWAVLIGVDKYHHIKSDRTYCSADVQALGEALIHGGFTPERVLVLHEESPIGLYPTKANIERQVRLTLEAAGPNDLVLVVFSGRGVRLEGTSYLCPADAEMDPSHLIAVEVVYRLMQDSRAKWKLFVVDASQDEAAVPKEIVPRHLEGEIRGVSFSVPDVLPEGILLLVSSSPGQGVVEESKFAHGVFMHYLLEGLQGEADLNESGTVTLAEWARYATKSTEKYVATLDRTQNPMMRGNFPDFDLAVVRSALPPLQPVRKVRINFAAYSPNGLWIVSAADGGTVLVWDVQKGEPVITLRGHSGDVYCANYSPHGRTIVSASEDSTAMVWDSVNGQKLLTLQGHASHVLSATYSPNGLWIVTAALDGTVMVWDTETGTSLLTLRAHSAPILTAAFSPDGRRLVTASADTTAMVWDATSAKGLLTLRGHTAPVMSAAYSPDGLRIVTASDDKTAMVWDAESGRPLLTLKGHTGFVYSAAFSPDGQKIVSASSDHTAIVWDAASGRKFLTLEGHSDQVRSAAFSPDGRRIVTASSDGTVIVWDAETGQRLFTYRRHVYYLSRTYHSQEPGTGTRSCDGMSIPEEGTSGN